MRTFGTVWIDGVGTGMPTGFDPVGVGVVIIVFVIIVYGIIRMSGISAPRQEWGE
jgi:hypothetical protein